jgi:ketosteroid isomerase-like protein
MARRPPPLPALVEDAVLAANQAFYDAFAARDVEAMEALWSREGPVACIHPGWNPLLDRDEIMAAWSAILRNPDAPDIRVENAIALILGDTAMVVCHERVGGALLACTNLFRLEQGTWRMVLHHAGPVGEEPLSRDDGAPLPHRIH